MGEKQYHLWRRFPTAPFRRWACTVAPEGESFKVLDFDPAVADAGFLHVVADHLRAPRGAVTRNSDGSTAVVTLQPGMKGHFDEAIRTVPHAVIRPIGRS